MELHVVIGQGAGEIIEGCETHAATAGDQQGEVLRMGVRSGDWGYIVPLLVGNLVAVAIYTALFVPIGYITSRAALIGIFYLFIWEFFLTQPDILGLTTSAPWRIGYSAYVGLAPDSTLRLEATQNALGTMLPGAGGAILKMLFAVTLLTLVTGWILQKRDLV